MLPGIVTLKAVSDMGRALICLEKYCFSGRSSAILLKSFMDCLLFVFTVNLKQSMGIKPERTRSILSDRHKLEN